MDEQHRRSVLKTAAASVALADCSENGGDDGPSADGQDDDPDSGTETVAVGDRPYTRWIPTPASAARDSEEFPRRAMTRPTARTPTPSTG
ncbi:MAG: hypothetical protein ACI8TL_001285, partial [Natronomonas sp.]